ncbi:YdeI family protein [Prevotella sp. MGM2]|uniref:YdeI/OmpD-associated family protein n=1 Tax=Prevotella sp. MGM2 TaxID=2033406 RepID=UPI000CE9DB4A|nr:YdeI/OmpD-associated family protein [Prevotella sp. MGM2]
MEFKNLLAAKSRRELREWLMFHHNIETECWVIVKRGRPQNDSTFWYVDAVEEAMCFGWIDSIIKKNEKGITVQKLGPRKIRSNWTELNKERCRRLERMRLMTDAGRKRLPDMSEKGFIIDKDILQTLQSDRDLWEKFILLPDLYKRVRIDTIQSQKKHSLTLFQNRLDKFIENTRKGILYGEWNDNERLLNY